MGVEGFVNVSVHVICFESCVLYSSGVIIIVLRERQFPLAFYGGTVSEVDCKFSYWVTCISQKERNDSCVCSLLAR